MSCDFSGLNQNGGSPFILSVLLVCDKTGGIKAQWQKEWVCFSQKSTFLGIDTDLLTKVMGSNNEI